LERHCPGSTNGPQTFWWSRRETEYDYGGIRCSEVRQLGELYMMNQVAEPTKSRIAQHLAQCPKCGPAFEEIKKKQKAERPVRIL
jgi:hypothetical protein